MSKDDENYELNRLINTCNFFDKSQEDTKYTRHKYAEDLFNEYKIMTLADEIRAKAKQKYRFLYNKPYTPASDIAI